jgi:CubicO group peptidase (beta-lactamase class C family)
VRRFFLVWAVGSTLWVANTMRTRGVPDSILQSTAAVRVAETGTTLEFIPARRRNDSALLFFCGGGVTAQAYAPLLRPVAEAGFPVFIVKLPYRFAPWESHKVGAIVRAKEAMAKHRDVGRWVVGGHSLGAALAARLTQSGPAAVAAMVLVGTTHPRDSDLSWLTIPVTKVYGSNDGVAPPERMFRNRHLLPSHTRWVEVAGGNHSQFGHYGWQLLDGRAAISREEQQALTRAALLPILAEPSAKAARSAFDGLFGDLHARGLFSGAVVVGRGSEIIWEKGFGKANFERGIAFTPDTPSDSGSLAKTITAALVIMLANEGKLDLDAPAQRLLPELPYPEITLRHLLSHSSGIPVHDYDYFDAYLPRDQVRTTEGLLGVIAAQKPRLLFRPGKEFEYSSFGFDLAALAAARAAGQRLDRLLGERIFHPLGINSAFLRPGRLGDFPGVRTLGYRTVDGAPQLHDVFDFEGFHGGSNIHISARELHRWSMAWLNASWIDERGLRPALEDARIGGERSGLTLGSWYHDADRKAFSYAGHLQGFHAEVFRDVQSRVSIVYVSNNTLSPWLQHSIVRAIRAIAAGDVAEALTPPATDEISREERSRLASTWALPDGERFEVEFAEGRTSLVRNGVRYRMVPVERKFFYVPGLDFMVGFKKGGSGDPVAMNLSSNFDDVWAKRIPH